MRTSSSSSSGATVSGPVSPYGMVGDSWCSTLRGAMTGDAYAHVTTNISPAVDGEPVDAFVTSDFVRVLGESGETLHGGR